MLEIGWSVLQQLLTWNVGSRPADRGNELRIHARLLQALILLLSLPFSALHLYIPHFRYYQTPSFGSVFISPFIHSFFYTNTFCTFNLCESFSPAHYLTI